MTRWLDSMESNKVRWSSLGQETFHLDDRLLFPRVYHRHHSRIQLGQSHPASTQSDPVIHQLDVCFRADSKLPSEVGRQDSTESWRVLQRGEDHHPVYT